MSNFWGALQRWFRGVTSERTIAYTIISVFSDRASSRIGEVAGRFDVEDGPGAVLLEGSGLDELVEYGVRCCVIKRENEFDLYIAPL